MGATRISKDGLEKIKAFEGGQSADGLFHAYFDKAGGVWTIGYGETQDVRPGMVWTEAQASHRLRSRFNKDYAPSINAMAKRYGLDLSQGEFDALASFVWNLGVGMLAEGSPVGGTIRRALKSRRRPVVAAAFLVYVFAGGQRLLGLVRRRRAERRLWLRRWKRLRKYRRELRVLRLKPRKTAKDRVRIKALRHMIHDQQPKER